MAQEATGILLPLCGYWQRFAIDDAEDAIRAVGNTTGEIAAPELRCNDFIDDTLCRHIGQRAFEAVADFDAELAIILATTRMAPSSIFLRPIFHASATRIEYCSIVSGCVVGTISTAIWLPFFASKSRKVRSSEAMSSLLSVPV